MFFVFVFVFVFVHIYAYAGIVRRKTKQKTQSKDEDAPARMRGRPSHTPKSLMDELIDEFPKAPADHEHFFGEKYEVKLRQVRDKAQKAQDKTEQIEEGSVEWEENTRIHKTLRVVETLMRMQRNFVAKESRPAAATFLEQFTQNEETREHNTHAHALAYLFCFVFVCFEGICMSLYVFASFDFYLSISEDFMKSGDFPINASIVPVCLHTTRFNILANWHFTAPDIPRQFSKSSLITALRSQTAEEVWPKQRHLIRLGLIALLTQDSTLAVAVVDLKKVLARLVAFQSPDNADNAEEYEAGLYAEIQDCYYILMPDKVPRASCQTALQRLPADVPRLEDAKNESASLPSLFIKYKQKGKAIVKLATDVLKEQEADVTLQQQLDAEIVNILKLPVTAENVVAQVQACIDHKKKVQGFQEGTLERLIKLGYNGADIDARLVGCAVMVLRKFSDQLPAFAKPSDTTSSFDFGGMKVGAMVAETKPFDFSGLRDALLMVDRLQQQEASFSKLAQLPAGDLRDLLKVLDNTDFELLRGKCVEISSEGLKATEPVWSVPVFCVVSSCLRRLKASVTESMAALSRGPLAQFVEKVSSVLNDITAVDQGDASGEVLTEHLAKHNGVSDALQSITSTISGSLLATVDGLRRWMEVRMAIARCYQLCLPTVEAHNN